MSTTSRTMAFFAYLLWLPGALLVLLLRRDDAFALYHGKQSLGIALATLVLPLAWMASAWSLAWIPVVGPMVAVTLFALVLAAALGLAVSWVVGMIYAIQGKAKPVPLVGSWAERLPVRSTQPIQPTAAEAYVTNDS